MKMKKLASIFHVESKSIKANYIYYSLYQVFNLLMPLVITPYISKTLGAEGVGAYSYTQSYISYLILLCDMGIGLFAMRKVSGIHSEEQKHKFFWEIIGTRVIISIVPLILYVFLLVTSIQYRELLLAELFFVFSGMIGVTWYFAGNENFQKTVLKSFITKLVGLLVTYICIKDPSDLVKYAFLMGIIQFIGEAMLWTSLPKKILQGYPVLQNVKENIIGALRVFMPDFANSIYKYGDKIMLGVITGTALQNGYYEQGQKIIVVSQGVIISMATVIMPRIAKLYSVNDKEKIRIYMNKTLQMSVLFGSALMFGIIGIAPNLVPWFFGKEFLPVICVLYVLAPNVVIHGMYYVLGYQYMLGTNQESRLTRMIFLGGIINVFFNIIMIPNYGAIGAAVGSLLAESIVVVLLVINSKEVIEWSSFIREVLKVVIAGVAMMYIVQRIGMGISARFVNTMLLTVIGSITYLMIAILLRVEVIWEQIENLKIKIRGKK